MLHNWTYPLLAIFVVALVTIFLRALPFMVFGNRSLPDMIRYLSRFLPPTIMTVLVIFFLKSVDFQSYPFGASELISCLLVIALQKWKDNMYLSIVLGTICYMVCLRVF